MSTIGYLKSLIKDKNIASITPTSKFGVKRLCGKIDFNSADTIVEYGPGMGVITKELLRRMKPSAKLIAIELNKEFYNFLKASINDSRLILVNDTAANVLGVINQHGCSSADYIISGIPFSLFDVELKDIILKATANALGSQGKFLVYQFPFSLSSKEVDISVKLKEHMVVLNTDFEILNIPPLRIYEARANETS